MKNVDVQSVLVSCAIHYANAETIKPPAILHRTTLNSCILSFNIISFTFKKEVIIPQ